MKTLCATFTTLVSASLLATCAGTPVALGTRDTATPAGTSRTISADAAASSSLGSFPLASMTGWKRPTYLFKLRQPVPPPLM